MLAGARDGLAVVVEEPVGCASIPLFHSMPGLMMWLSAQAAQAARITAGKPGRIPRSLELLHLAVARVTHILVAMVVLGVDQM